MKKILRDTLIVVAVIVVGAGLFFGVVAYSRWNAWYGGYRLGMMGNGYAPYQANSGQQGYYGPGGMMNGNGNGYGGTMNGSGYGGMMDGGMMNGTGPNNTQVLEVSADMPVSADEASQVAQRYLDAYYLGVKVSDEVTAFYRYYTMDIERDGKIIGMMSVNGSTRQVFPHTWHRKFIEMSEE